jgi:hypothetical protein
VPEPAVVELQPVDSVWQPPHQAYENPPTAPLRLNRAERREAVRYWKTVGVLDERGRVAAQWKTVVGALFPSSTD